MPDTVSAMQVLRDAGMAIDPDEAAALRARRRTRLHTRVYPLLRLAALNLLVVGVILHNGLILERLAWPAILWLTASYNVYALGSWALLAGFYARTDRAAIDLGDVFIILDVPLIAAAVYVSGASASWLFFALITHVADQSWRSGGWLWFFVHFGVACYAGVLGYSALVDGATLDWGDAAAKLLLLWGAGAYLAATSRPRARLRRQRTAAMDVATTLIRRLKERSEQLDRANRAKSEFLATVRHEVVTLMGLGNVLLQNRNDTLRETELGYVERICASGMRLLDLSDAFQEAEEPEGPAAEGLARVPLHPLLEAAVDDARQETRTEREVRLELPEEDGELETEPVRLRQVVANLVDHALRWEGAGPITVTLRLEPESGLPARIDIADPATDTTADDLATMLQGATDADPGSRAAGIGLAVAQAMCEEMGYRLEATAPPGGGTALSIVFR